MTERQRAVMERIDRRVPIKVIAQELGVSETRINQHIRALKDIFGSESLGDLVECYRATLPDPDINSEDPTGEASQKDLSEAVYTKKQVHGSARYADDAVRVDHGELVMSDVLPLIEQAPWLRSGEPKVVPGMLDGDNAVLFRLVAIVGIAFGVLSAMVLTVTAAVALSEAMDGKATVPVEQARPST
jgi:DNA-binding CsgD family transcriptional regulator